MIWFHQTATVPPPANDSRGNSGGRQMKKHILIIGLILNMIAAAAANESTGKYYGLWWDASTSTEYFVRIDPATSTKTIMDSIPGVKLINAGNYAFDTDCDRYVFVGGPTTSSMSYYVIDAHTGAVISKSPRGANINSIAYSHQDKAFYGLSWDGSAEYLVSIDPYTSTQTALKSIPGVSLIVGGNYAFDADCNRYVFIGGPSSGAMSYYVMNAHTGAVVSQNLQGGKVDEIAYGGISAAGGIPVESSDPAIESDGSVSINSSNRSKESLVIHPNLFSNGVTLEIQNGNDQNFSFTLQDLFGKTVFNRTGIHTNKIRIEEKALTPSIYFYLLRNDRGLVGAGRLKM